MNYYTNDSKINYYSCLLYSNVKNCLECPTKEKCTQCVSTNYELVIDENNEAVLMNTKSMQIYYCKKNMKYDE